VTTVVVRRQTEARDGDADQDDQGARSGHPASSNGGGPFPGCARGRRPCRSRRQGDRTGGRSVAGPWRTESAACPSISSAHAATDRRAGVTRSPRSSRSARIDPCDTTDPRRPRPDRCAPVAQPPLPRAGAGGRGRRRRRGRDLRPRLRPQCRGRRWSDRPGQLDHHGRGPHQPGHDDRRPAREGAAPRADGRSRPPRRRGDLHPDRSRRPLRHGGLARAVPDEGDGAAPRAVTPAAAPARRLRGQPDQGAVDRRGPRALPPLR
jgi:hypothetical protein